MAGSSFTVGVAAPTAAAVFYNPARLRISFLVVGATAWAVIAALLHLAAQKVLKGLRE
jgi:hypothetical protein